VYACKQLVASIPKAQKLVGHGFVKVGPLEAVRVGRAVAIAFPPERGITKTIYVLRGAVEGEVDQGVGLPVAGQYAPDRDAAGEEIPLAGRFLRLPRNLQFSAVSRIPGDRTHCLDCHDGHRQPPVIEGKPVLACVRRLDGDAVTGLNRFHPVEIPVFVPILPDTFVDETGGLIVGAAVRGTHKPACRAAGGVGS